MRQARALVPWILLLSFFVVAGCAQLGLVPAQSFDQKLAYVQGGITSARTSAEHAVLAGTIKSADAQKVLELTDNATDAVKAARNRALWHSSSISAWSNIPWP